MITQKSMCVEPDMCTCTIYDELPICLALDVDAYPIACIYLYVYAHGYQYCRFVHTPMFAHVDNYIPVFLYSYKY